MRNILNNAGVLMWTGLMSIVGFISGLMIFKPENVTFNKKDANSKNEMKESE